MAKDTKLFTNLAGEFLVAAELNRRHILCSVTYGASKSADVFAFSDNNEKMVRIEVKCAENRADKNTKWLIGQKGYKAGSTKHIWVFVLLPDPLDEQTDDDYERGRHSPRYFVLTGAEIQKLAERNHEAYSRKYQDKHGKSYPKEKGVPGIRLNQVVIHEAAWNKITKAMGEISITCTN